MSRQHRYQSIPLGQRLKWLDNVPREIAMVSQWLCFRLEPHPTKAGKYLKVPYYAHGGKRYGHQGTEEDRSKLVPLEQAVERVKKGKADGVGFAPLEGGAASAVDFDGSDSVAQNARVIAKTWSEVSVGGEGAHIFVLGNIDSNRKPKGEGIEFFSTAGFVAVTGEPLAGCDGVPIRGKKLVHRMLAEKLNGHAPARTAVVNGHDTLRNIPTTYNEHERAKIIDAFKVFKCSMADYQQWLTVGQALHSADPDPNGPTFKLWLQWSKRDDARFVNEDDLAHRWVGFSGGRGITLATLYGYARDVKAKREAKKRNEEAKDETKGVSFGEIEQIEFGQANIFIEGLIGEGLVLLTGQKKVAKKTFWVLQCAALASAGEPFMGREVTQPLRVLCYMLEEGGMVYDKHGKEVQPFDVVAERIRAMGLSEQARKGQLMVKATLPSLEEGGFEQIELDASRNDLIFIDSRQMIINEESDRERNIWRKDYKHLAPLREIARKHHCGIIVVNHASKGSDTKDAIDAGAATGGIDAAVDGMIVLQNPDKDDPDRIRMTLYHRRLKQIEHELRWNHETCMFEDMGSWIRAQGRMAEVLGVLVARTAKKDDAPLSALQISRHVFGPNAEKNRANVSRLLVKLKRDGLAIEGYGDDEARTKLWRCTKAAIRRDEG